MSITVSAQLDRNKISRDKDYEGHLMVSISSKDENFKRTPVQAILVIDISGSMQGEKLTSVKSTATKIVENLTDQDEVSIITFSDTSKVVLTRQKVVSKEAIYSAISAIGIEGSTNLSAGILTGVQQVDDKFAGVRRLMVLTDGMANKGVQDSAGLSDLVSKRDKNCTMSFFGYGNDCDNDLLAALAKAGGGNHYFIGSSKDIANLFAKELGGITACKAQSIQILVKPNKGGKVMEVLNDYTVEEQGDNALIKAEDIYVNETKHVIIKFKVAKPDGKIKDRAFSVAHVEVSYDDLDTKKRESVSINVKTEFVKDADADAKPILAVAEQVAVLTAAKAQIEASKAAMSGDFGLAKKLFASGSAMLCAAEADGSLLAFNAKALYVASADVVDEATYSITAANSLSNSARGVGRGRSTTKGMSSLYMSPTQLAMEKKFEEPEVLPAPPMSGSGPVISGGSWTPIAPILPDNIDIAKIDIVSKGFSKKRSGDK